MLDWNQTETVYKIIGMTELINFEQNFDRFQNICNVRTYILNNMWRLYHG